MTDKVRVRFAPSPTGPLHIGGVRTALFNYLFAKKHNGDFILRIEDTDQNRFVKGAEDYIVNALDWCNISVDEGLGKGGNYGPYRQSERRHLYQNYVSKLIETNAAYYAFDSAEQLDFHRKNHEAKGKTFIYNWHNRLKLNNSLSLSEQETQERINSGESYVIRFKVPQDYNFTITDRIRGQISIDSNVLDDKILFKSDGMPTYHLANVVDDYLMRITHVIRGEEWLPSLPLHHLLYDAFGWNKPKFAHLPLILKPVGKGKLSKRDSEKGGFPIFPLNWKDSEGYREAGYLPEAVVNFLAFLGWNPTTEQELFTLTELIHTFSFKGITKSGSRFDPDKTKWYNQKWLQRKTAKELVKIVYPILEKNNVDNLLLSDSYIESVIHLLQNRMQLVTDFWKLSDYFFVAPQKYAEKPVKKQWKPETSALLEEVFTLLKETTDFTSDNVEKNIKDWIRANDLSLGKIMGPLRLVIVGDLKGPHLFDIMALIGKDACLQRITNAINRLGKAESINKK